jgi:signal transduction histidine kinase
VSRLGSLARGYGLDVLIVLAAIEAAVEIALIDDPLDAPRTPSWFAAPAIALIVLVLLARHRFPFAAPATFWVLGSALSVLDGRLIVLAFGVFAAGLGGAFLLGKLPDEVRPRIGLAIVVSGAATVIYHNPHHTSGELIIVPALFAVTWLAGFALRARAAEARAAERRAALAERERESAARIAVAEERARITRELHDIVAHAVSVMVLQVGAVRHRLPPTLAEDREALRGVERAGRAALTEMRHLLGALHDEGQDVDLAPQPSLASLDALVDKVRHAGLPVRLRVESGVEGDTAPLPRAIELSAYRIVQEGLTNALKHANASHAEVTVRHRADRLEVDVVDDGTGAGPGDGLGRGLVGIRERVKIYGGELTARTGPGGGFVLSASLPLDGYPP